MILQEPDPLQIKSPYWNGFGVIVSFKLKLYHSISLVLIIVPSVYIAPLKIAIIPGEPFDYRDGYTAMLLN